MTTLIVCENAKCTNKAYALMSGEALCRSCIDTKVAQHVDKSRKPFIIELGSGMPAEMMGGARMTQSLLMPCAPIVCSRLLSYSSLQVGEAAINE